QLRRENIELATRFSLAEQQGDAVAQRVGAIEVTIPDMIEAAGGEALDPTTTASIDTDAESFDADGGSVTVTTIPVVPSQPMPQVADAEPPRADGDAYGVALGLVVDPYGAPAAWAGLNARVGTLL